MPAFFGWSLLGLSIAGIIMMPFSGCSVSSSGDGPDEITMVNNADKPLTYLAYDKESSHTLDPNPEFKVDPGADNLLQTGDSVKIQHYQIEGDYTRGNEIRLFLWKVTNDTARLNNIIDYTAEALQARDYLIKITMDQDGLLISKRAGQSKN